MSGFNMPPGVSPCDIPGNGPDEHAVPLTERLPGEPLVYWQQREYVAAVGLNITFKAHRVGALGVDWKYEFPLPDPRDRRVTVKHRVGREIEHEYPATR